jgi:hypothetical protein
MSEAKAANEGSHPKKALMAVARERVSAVFLMCSIEEPSVQVIKNPA